MFCFCCGWILLVSAYCKNLNSQVTNTDVVINWWLFSRLEFHSGQMQNIFLLLPALVFSKFEICRSLKRKWKQFCLTRNVVKRADKPINQADDNYCVQRCSLCTRRRPFWRELRTRPMFNRCEYWNKVKRNDVVSPKDGSLGIYPWFIVVRLY